jgi:hypothetical protein
MVAPSQCSLDLLHTHHSHCTARPSHHHRSALMQEGLAKFLVADDEQEGDHTVTFCWSKSNGSVWFLPLSRRTAPAPLHVFTHSSAGRGTLMPFTSSIVTFPGSSALIASCNGRWCTDAGLSNPISRPDAAEIGTRMRLVSLWSCGHVRVPWVRVEGDVQRDVAANPKGLPRSILRLAWDPFTGLERPVCDPSLGPGTGLAQRDRSQGLPAREEASATSAPPQHHRRAGTPSSARIHTPVMCTIPQAFLGQPARSHRSSTERGALDTAWTARLSCCSLDPASGSVHCC